MARDEDGRQEDEAEWDDFDEDAWQEWHADDEEDWLCEEEGGTGACRLMDCADWGGDGLCFLAMGGYSGRKERK